MQFAGWGESGQAKIAKAKVVQVGCGGLGSTLAQCMARAGVGKLTLIDRDIVDITNLHRQFLFDEEDAAKKIPKAAAAAEKLKRADSKAELAVITEALSSSNADRLLSGHDLVLDGTDNMETRYVINDWCVRNHIPWIYGGVVGATGMTMVILPGKGPCIQCLYPADDLKDKTAPSIEDTGIINTAPAMVALLQSTEAMKLLIGSPDVIRDLRIIDLWSGAWQHISVSRNPQCPCCGISEQ
jgi:adenylyltransferase/sulfurtransferase